MKRARTVRLAVATTLVATAASVVTSAPSSGATAPKAVSGGQRESVIVVLKNQLTSQPANATHMSARHANAIASQRAVLAHLSGAAPTHVINYTVGNAFSATITTGQAAQLAADPAVASVVANRKVALSPPSSTATGTAQSNKAQPADTTGPSPVNPAACSTDPKKPMLEPEALQTINARSSNPAALTAAKLGIDGAGVKVAFIADGINPNNEGFIRKDGTSAIIDYKDFYGDGPNAVTSGAEAFGDASAIAAQGNVTYDVANYANPNVVSFPGGHCYIKIVGVAPGASVVALKAGSELLPNSAILQSIDYAVTVAKVNVINESFGANIYPDSGARNTIQLFNDNAIAAGVTVVNSTGDAGITSTIGSPATDPEVISAGASTDNRLYEQTGYALATRFSNGTWQDSNISALSSAGITQDGRTIDVSAPGEADWAVCDNSGNFVGCTSFGNPNHQFVNIQAFGGTSQSSPITAGVAALVIQAYRQTHNGDSPTPAVVKTIITSTAQDLGMPGEDQGSGLINARAAVEAAFTWPGATTAAPAGTGQNIALSANQLTLSGAPGTTKTGKITVTNVGTQAQTIATTTRYNALLSTETHNVGMDTSSSQTVPYPTTGAPWVFKKMTFDVPGGANELDSTIRWQSGATYNGAGPVVRLSLFAPDGSFATNTRPQGGAAPANYGLATVRHPMAGTWTAVLYTPVAGGFTGNVKLTSATYRSLPIGNISPSTTTIAPGASTTVSVQVPVPSVGGDTVYTASIGSSGGHQVAVPLIMRAVIPTSSHGTGHFAGTITGGNARAYSPAQTFSYAFDVPKGQSDLAVATNLANDPADLLEGVLVDPNGEVQSVNSNQTLSKSFQTRQTLSMQNTVAKPQSGRWHFVVVVQSPVSGKELTENFTGTVRFNRISVSAPDLPSTLPAGTPFTEQIQVTNNGSAPMLVQTDARAGNAKNIQLAPQFAGSTLSLPQSVDDLSQIPGYLVAPDTSSLSLTASSSVPAQVELNNPTGGIDVFGDLAQAQSGNTISTATVSESNNRVGLGYWGTYVQEIGPYGDGGAPSGTSTLSATAKMVPFDKTVATSTGDPYIVTVDPTANPGAPVVINPGETGTITVQITPSGQSGKVVSGVLHLVTTPLGIAQIFNTSGEVLANIPYQYTIS
jgi:hypothetical protein